MDLEPVGFTSRLEALKSGVLMKVEYFLEDHSQDGNLTRQPSLARVFVRVKCMAPVRPTVR
jgi:hypothetical protein